MKSFKVISILVFTILCTQISFAQTTKSGTIGTMQKVQKKKSSKSGNAKRKAKAVAEAKCREYLERSFELLDEMERERVNKTLTREQIEDIQKGVRDRKEELMQECILLRMQEMGY